MQAMFLTFAPTWSGGSGGGTRKLLYGESHDVLPVHSVYTFLYIQFTQSDCDGCPVPGKGDPSYVPDLHSNTGGVDEVRQTRELWCGQYHGVLSA